MNSQTSMANMQKFLLIFFLSFFFIHGRAQNLIEYPYRSCSNATLSPNSTYFSNLKALSSVLSSNASRKLYHKASVGRQPNFTAYGDFQCRGDLNATACRQCVATATSNSSQQYCPLSVQAVVWFDECFFRYSNESFFSILAKQPPLILINGEDIEEDVEGFNQVVASTLSDTVANASSMKGELKFASKEGNFRDATVYALAQCTADLSTSDCGKCLRDAVQNFPDCCSGKKGGRVLFPSCTIRYELYAFYSGFSRSSISSPPASAPALPPPAAPNSLLPSTPSAPPPSTAAPSLLSGEGRATVALVIGTVAAYFLT